MRKFINKTDWPLVGVWLTIIVVDLIVIVLITKMLLKLLKF